MMGAGLAGIGTVLPIRQFARFEDSMLSVRAKTRASETDEYSELSAAIQNCSGVAQKTADMMDSSLGGSFRFVLTASTAARGLLNVVVNGFLNTLFLGRYVVVGFAASLGLRRTAAMGIPATIATTKTSILAGVTTEKTAILGISATFVAMKTAIVAASVSLYASFVALPAAIGAIVASMTFTHVAAVAIFAGIATLCGVVL
ncbi:MAG: hypothetical protein Q4D62_05410 [Planctomycetia bacterium]|nr:hypothetical protein [Planctomycetia bacterium]